MIRRDYLIVGAGVGGASVCEGIREHDKKGTVMLVGAEAALPYHRPKLIGSYASSVIEAPTRAELEAALCWESSDLVPRRPAMTAFRQWARLHQAQWREREGHPVRIGAVTDSGQPDDWLAAIANGGGIALAPESAARYYARPGVTYRPVTGISPSQVGVAWPPAADTNPVIQDFIRCCLENKPPHDIENPT